MDQTTAFLCGLDHFPEVVDRTHEGILQWNLRFPIEDCTGSGDIGPSDFGVVGRQRMVADGAGGAGEFQHQIRDIQNRQFTWVSDIYGIVHTGPVVTDFLCDEELTICPLFDCPV